MSKTIDVESEKRFSIHEDWAVVVLGFLIILISLAGILVPVPSFSWNTPDELFQKVLSSGNLGKAFIQFLFLYAMVLAAAYLINKSVKSAIATFPLIFILTFIALVISGNSEIKALNLESVIFSLSIGLLVSNVFNLPTRLRESLSAELFVKIGLVLLGTGVIFSDILKAGGLGLIQALVVVISVWYFAFWVCKKLKIDEELSMMISSAVSICGVSAAIATAGAIKGDTKKLSYVISLVLITAIPMMIVMPYIAKQFNFPEAVTGAWLGGSIDTTGAVVASGSLVGDTALKISTIVKFSQNVLLGLAAFAISIYWTYSHDGKNNQRAERPTLGLIWERFPKFVLGFILASMLFSFVLNEETVSTVKESLKSIQTLWFVLAFTSIGLETKFSDIFNENSKRPLYGFLIAQTFNILITLVVAYILFS
ncbi:putative sulfate exporter family transporter [Chryseolinea sp. H1M3-3]|uniref:YeiH family protein n=1 Tax=Chryseolinea sp. H1M3-3 TaxID=3034144 RepID=UPI0023EDC9B6|nr:putative sulfate exporter family transporter [Chryseolinea sp. H1M3-3]